MRTDDMVREALADLAPTAPADNTALAGVHRAIGRRRRRQHVAQAVAAVALAATAVGTGALLLRAEDNKVQTGSGGDGRPATTEPTTATTPTTGTPKPGEGDRTQFGPVSFVLPQGWEATPSQKLTDPETGAQGDFICIAPTDDTGPVWEDCSGLLIYRGDYIPGSETRPYEPHTAAAWSHSFDVPSCPFEPPAFGPDFDGVDTSGALIEQSFRPVGDKSAYYDRWQANCQRSDHPFEPQAWFLPQSKVLVLDIFGHPETAEFLASFEFEE